MQDIKMLESRWSHLCNPNQHGQRDESQHLLCKYKSLNQARKQNNPDESVPKKLLNIINVYGPTTTLVKQDVKMLDKLYMKLSNLLNDFRNKTGSINIVLGDFNAKKGVITRGRRNNSGQLFINFCGLHEMFIANSAFKHPARHITTYSKTFNEKASL